MSTLNTITYPDNRSEFLLDPSERQKEIITGATCVHAFRFPADYATKIKPYSSYVIYTSGINQVCMLNLDAQIAAEKARIVRIKDNDFIYVQLEPDITSKFNKLARAGCEFGCEIKTDEGAWLPVIVSQERIDIKRSAENYNIMPDPNNPGGEANV